MPLPAKNTTAASASFASCASSLSAARKPSTPRSFFRMTLSKLSFSRVAATSVASLTGFFSTGRNLCSALPITSATRRASAGEKLRPATAQQTRRARRTTWRMRVSSVYKVATVPDLGEALVRSGNWIGTPLGSAGIANSLIGGLEVELLVFLEPVPQLRNLEPARGHFDLRAHEPEKLVGFQARRIHMLQEGGGERTVVPDPV